jgi:hypothetical protein
MTSDHRVSRLMALARDAKNRTASWSEAKKDYARRVVNASSHKTENSQPQKPKIFPKISPKSQ